MQPVRILRADNLGRFILDLQTPAEKTVGRVVGCFSKLAMVCGPFILISLLSSDFGFFSKFFRIGGLALVVAFFYYCRRTIDCYYVLDDVGGQLLYHFSAILMVSEDPVANIEDVIGIGVTFSGNDSYAVIFCLADGKTVRVTNFISLHEANQIAEEIARIVNLPCMPAEQGERVSIVVENQKMLKKAGAKFVTSSSVSTASGCLAMFFLAPYILFPTMAVYMFAMMIVTGDFQTRDLKYYLKSKSYAVIDIDGKEIHSVKAKPDNRRVKKANSKAPAAVKAFPGSVDSTYAEVASGTIVPGQGIIGLVELGEEMGEVLRRFNVEPPAISLEDAPTPGYNRRTRKYVSPVEHRENLLDGALSMVFTAKGKSSMRLTRIEIFNGRQLPYQTIDKLTFNSSVQEIIELGDVKKPIRRVLEDKVRRQYPNASFFTTSRRKIEGGFEEGYGVDFAKEGISYTFFGETLQEITITGKKR